MLLYTAMLIVSDDDRYILLLSAGRSDEESREVRRRTVGVVGLWTGSNTIPLD